MNTHNIARYAPKARIDFIDAVTRQAARYGITAECIEPMVQKGDLVLIGERPFPKSIARARNALQQQVQAQGFHATMDQAAYSWFNRLCAIRFMELKGYLDHGRRVLSHPSDPQGFQILDDCLDIELPGLDRETLVELKLDGSNDEALYRELLLAQCHALHSAMPFLFEALDDATELLLPQNLTKTDSLIRDLIAGIPEQDWQDIEIIGWLYQFYISDKKDQVIGKVVKSEDIPAATQLFTPNWIVKYMVQNSLGAQWLATYPESPLKAQMAYYIEPAEQTDEVNAQLAAITPDSLNPEALTLIDPASGSGHILVEAYELFKAIYLERGYRQRDLPQLILEKNLFGLDIDERAAQLTGFALMMKGRADDRRLFERGIKLNVMALQDSAGFDVEGLAQSPEVQATLADYGLKVGDLIELKRLFEHATTFGSLIQVPEELAAKLPALKQLGETTTQDLFVAEALKRLGPQVAQAELLAAQYDAVVANPPYMGSKGMTGVLKKFVKDNFADTKSDLFACFIERGFVLAKGAGHNAMVTMQSWMFLSSFEKMRERMLREKTIRTMAHLGARAFGSISGEVVQTTAAVLRNCKLAGYRPVFFRLVEGNEFEKQTALCCNEQRFDAAAQSEFRSIPGSPLAYWVSDRVRELARSPKAMGDVARARMGLATGNNDKYVRLWHEVDRHEVAYNMESRVRAKESGRRWFPYAKGGPFRKWFGNNTHVVDWLNDGHEMQTRKHPTGRIWAHNFNLDMIFRDSITWSDITSGSLSVRWNDTGFLFDGSGTCAFFDDEDVKVTVIGLLNSKFVQDFAKILNPTFHFQTGDFRATPFLDSHADVAWRTWIRALVATARTDWNAYERSWDFQSLPLLNASSEPTPTLESSYTAWITQNRATIAEMQRLEEENNRLFIDAYGLADELTPDVPIEQITLTVNPAYRYGGKLTVEEQWTRFRQDTLQELVSYAIGCIMGRYSLDRPGLIYAHSGNEGFDSSQYPSFPADEDGIIPLTDIEWFADDACNRVIEFIGKAWDAAQLEQNLAFLADNLSPKKNESSRDTLRRYISAKFFKDHLQTYKKRPIYWLFSSGKQKAFECLVYLHRYNEGTLARMRTEYVIPLSAKMSTYEQKLEQDKAASSSAAETRRLEKEIAKLHKQQAELAQFDEKLRHFADQRIPLDLDDGVKVNYGKFGDLLAEVKAITGKKPEAA
ncbi:BREX-1 system adenine-specific DNA-methyltransferase PglX [Microbulbifer sp. CNSA002]|uniref:BREX-1 system adenine-specific DNA-methyltransferase PglX n=1 Tax=Microbulbifer sp. CNSA002 TaxID=3373604 RepID=UPI0039B51F9C